MIRSVFHVVMLTCIMLVSGCGDESENPVAVNLDTDWLITYTQYGRGWSQSVTADGRGGFNGDSFRIETDTVWYSDGETHPTNMTVILEGTHARDSTYSGHLRIIERAYGTDGSDDLDVTFTSDRKRFVTAIVERRSESNELMASYRVYGVRK